MTPWPKTTVALIATNSMKVWSARLTHAGRDPWLALLAHHQTTSATHSSVNK
jgi:hypothetical protein